MPRFDLVDVARLKDEFQSLYRTVPRVFSAPGRVNLIGEHTDYNEGFVLPMAIERRTYVAGAPNGTSRIRVKSLTLGQAFELDLNVPGPKKRGTWLDYVEGTARALIERDIPVVGTDLLIDSDVPAGAGVSASAALELGVGIALAMLGGTPEPDRLKLALAGQAAEHQYVGTLCGIMDQYIASLGREGAALLIDCRSLETKTIPIRMKDVSVLICDTRVKHELSSSEYNLRRAECQRGAEILAKSLPGVRSLRDVTVSDFERFEAELPSIVRNRCRHVVTENARTLAAADALTAGELATAGKLMNESHLSLRDDYQVSCEELDVAVDTAQREVGVYGSRMTGGGFGGCTVTLVDNAAIPRVEAAVKAAFAARGWKEPELFASKACEGAREE